MSVIYLRHDTHGTKVASSESEATYDEGLGWKRFTPTVEVPKVDTPEWLDIKPAEDTIVKPLKGKK